MKPLEHFDEVARDRLDKYLGTKSIDRGYRFYRSPKGFGDISFDFQRLRVSLDDREIASLTDELMKFSLTGKFVNVRYDDQKFSRSVLDSVLGGELFEFKKNGKKVLVEHTSSNPNSPLHIGRARNSIIGDTVARILSKYGFDVKREYYVNDIGTQIEAFLISLDVYGKDNYAESYRRISQNMDQYKGRIEESMKKAESGDVEFLHESRARLQFYLNDLLKDLKELDISFDNFVWESDFILDGSVKRIIERLSPMLEDDGGAKYIDSPEGKLYVMRSNGTSVYFTRDIVYHLRKAENFDISIDVLGEDHKNHVRKLDFVLKKLGVEDVVALFYSYITTKEGKLSTRRGNVIFLRDLIREAKENAKKEILKRRNDLSEETVEEISAKIGNAAVRYNIIKYSPEKPITFDWADALNFDGDAAPFVMYSYARARSILSKAGKNLKMKYEFVEAEIDLMRKIALFPEVVEDAAKHHRPDRVAKYSYELASSFNQFYRDCPVIGDNENYQRRVEIVKATVKTIEEVLLLLGIEPSDKI